jgi:hypothetical protein
MKSDLLQEPELKILFENGVLKKAIIFNSEMQNGFNVMFEKSKGLEYYGMRLQRDKAPRLFKSIDGAVAACKKIGFRIIEVNLSVFS